MSSGEEAEAEKEEEVEEEEDEDEEQEEDIIPSGKIERLSTCNKKNWVTMSPFCGATTTLGIQDQRKNHIRVRFS